MHCTRCQGTGFLNYHQLEEDADTTGLDPETCTADEIIEWLEKNPAGSSHDVQVCDVCGDGVEHYGEPGNEPVSVEWDPFRSKVWI